MRGRLPSPGGPCCGTPIVLKVEDCTARYQELKSRGVEFKRVWGNELNETPQGVVVLTDTMLNPDVWARTLVTVQDDGSNNPCWYVNWMSDDHRSSPHTPLGWKDAQQFEAPAKFIVTSVMFRVGDGI